MTSNSNVTDLPGAYKLAITDVINKHGIVGSQSLFNVIHLETIDDEAIENYLFPVDSELDAIAERDLQNMVLDFKRARLIELIETDIVRVSRYINDVKMSYPIYSLRGTPNDR